MSAENKAVLRRFFKDVLEGGNVSAVGQIVAHDFVDHQPAPGQGPGVEGVKQFVAGVRGGLSHLRVELEHVVAEGDLVASHVTISGLHTGDLFGMPPSGKDVTIRISDIVRMQNGKVTERWGVEDLSGLMV